MPPPVVSSGRRTVTRRSQKEALNRPSTAQTSRLAGPDWQQRLAVSQEHLIDRMLGAVPSECLYSVTGLPAQVRILCRLTCGKCHHTGNPQITADLRRWTGHLRAVLDQPGGSEAFIVLLTYIELVSDAPVGELRDLAASLGPDAEEAYVTTAEMLRAEGEARGKASGKTEDILVVFEQRGIDVDERSRELIESCTDLDTLNGWFRRAFKVGKASDLFEK
jgi:hypothetical protein